jgi:hypothetical protein
MTTTPRRPSPCHSSPSGDGVADLGHRSVLSSIPRRTSIASTRSAQNPGGYDSWQHDEAVSIKRSAIHHFSIVPRSVRLFPTAFGQGGASPAPVLWDGA